MNFKLFVLLLCSLPAFGAISRVQFSAPVRFAGGNTANLTLPGVSTAGNAIYVGCGCESGCTLNTPTDGEGHTYALLKLNNSSSSVTTGVWRAPVPSTTGAAVTVTCTSSGATINTIVVAEYTNDTATEDGESLGDFGYPYTTTSFDCGTFSTSVANNLVIAFLYYQAGTDAATLAAGSGFTEVTELDDTTNGTHVGLLEKITTSSGSQNPTFTRATGDTAFGSCVAVAIQDVSQPASSRKRSGVF